MRIFQTVLEICMCQVKMSQNLKYCNSKVNNWKECFKKSIPAFWATVRKANAKIGLEKRNVPLIFRKFLEMHKNLKQNVFFKKASEGRDSWETARIF